MDIELHRKFAIDVLKLQGDRLENYLKEVIYRERNLRSGEDVIHLMYHAIPDDHLEEFRNKLQENKLELSYMDQLGVLKATTVNPLLHFIIGSGLAASIFNNVVWEIIVHYFLKFRESAISRLRTFVRDGDDYSRLPNASVFSIDVKNKKCHFEVSDNIDPKVVEITLKRMNKVVEKIAAIEISEPLYLTFVMTDKGEWEFQDSLNPKNVKKNKSKSPGKKKKRNKGSKT